MAVIRYLAPLAVLAVLLVLAACAGPGGSKGSTPEGARLYALHCSACHGKTGKGGVGIPLALEDFLENVDDDYIHRTVRVGRPGRVMPPFWQLSDEEIQSIVDLLRSWTWSPEPSFSDEPIEGDVARGGELYAKHCAECHGKDGEGGEGTGLSFSRARDLPILAPALNNVGFLASASDHMIRETLIKGRLSTPMVSFVAKKGLSEQDIDDIVRYVRSFREHPTEKTRLKEVDEVVLVRESPYDYEQTMRRVRKAIAGSGFQLLREQFLEQGLAEVGGENPYRRVLLFADFRLINDALERDPRMGLFLPGRITVIEQDGAVKMMTYNPRHLSQLFSNTALNSLGENLYERYVAILEEAAQ